MSQGLPVCLAVMSQGSAVGSVDTSFAGRGPARRMSRLKKFPQEFKRDVVRVARRGDLSHAEVAADFDISVESVRRWVRQADIDDGVVNGQTTSEQNELVQLRRDKRRLEMENEILRRAAAYFAAGSLPK